MVKVIIPANNIPERKYLLNVIFNQYLKVSYRYTVSKKLSDEYIICKESKKVVVKDHFFSFYQDDLAYLKFDSIPKNIKHLSHPLFAQKELPILFGDAKIEITKDKIVSHIDIFATIFFMLTRWEEHVTHSKDAHGRFNELDSLALKEGFLKRPIVNEYIEFLWNMFVALDFREKRYQHKFSVRLTHDVDEVLAYPTFKKFLRNVAGDVIVRKKPLLALNRVGEYIGILQGKIKDPYDTFDEIMDISDRFNIKSHFFFMSGGVTKYDNFYNIESQKELIDKIVSRGHIVGIHPSYSAYNSCKQFRKEKNRLESVTGFKIESGREHYLRFEVPLTWQIWDSNGLSWCSNMTYPDSTGFRAGTCYPYTPFNIMTREQLSIIERPVTVMEAALMWETEDEVEFEKEIDYYLEIVKKYGGEFVFLWHNSNLKSCEDFSAQKMRRYAQVYKRTIQKQMEFQDE